MSYDYRFEPGTPGARPLLLLHGTGGDRNSLVPVGRMISAESPLLLPEGKFMEGGVGRRFFERYEEGILNEESLRHYTEELADWLPITAAEKGLALDQMVGVGYSNGATTLGALMLLRPGIIRHVVLLRPMAPFVDPPSVDLTGTRVLLLASLADAITPYQGAVDMRNVLVERGAEAEVVSVPGGHSLTQVDFEAIQDWLG